MNKELTNELIELMEKNAWVIFSTSDMNNRPHAIVVLLSRVEKNRIIISNIQMNQSIENVKSNPKCFINAYIKDKDDLQIKINCTAEVYDDGELYHEIKEYEETNNLPEDLKVRSIIVANVDDVEVCEG